MKFSTILQENSILVLSNGLYLLTFEWKEDKCVATKTPIENNGDLNYAAEQIVAAWFTSAPEWGEVKLALYRIAGRAFEYALDEDNTLVFEEKKSLSMIDMAYYYDASYRLFNK